MPVYKAPLRDMKFLLNEVFDYPGHYTRLKTGENATPDIVDAILNECSKFCEEVLSPLYQSGDEEGCRLDNGEVITPTGYREAYQQYAQGGWQGLSAPEEYGGQGLPASMGLFKQEMMGTANWSFSMYPGLSMGAMNTIFLHGSQDQKQTYLVPLTEGRWGGTMCLTEPQCGTDLGQVKTKAALQEDGSFKLSGTKIFISSGDHDLTENIVHIVLARLPDAPKGTRGISLFIVPKFLPDGNGGVGEANGVSCGSLEKKMGIKASATSLIHHADVRRMLLTQKAIAEGGRAMLYYAARLADHMVEGHTTGDQKKVDAYDDKLGFLTPILKGFLTELGNEAANHGVQVFGGHGYIREHGMEQIVRDTRIATLYEGTTGIQALDLLGRKVLLMTQGGAVREFTLKVANFARKTLTDKRVRPFSVELLKLTAQWNVLTVRLMLAARKDRDVVSSAAHDFLMYSGYVTMAYMWARMAAAASDKLDKGGADSEDFYRAKLATAEFYYERLLPRAQAHATGMLSPSRNLMQLAPEHMAFTD